MKKFDIHVTYSTGWVEIELDDEFIEECDSAGIDITDDNELIREYLNNNLLDEYLELDDYEFKKTEDDDEEDYEDDMADYEDEEEEDE